MGNQPQIWFWKWFPVVTLVAVADVSPWVTWATAKKGALPPILIGEDVVAVVLALGAAVWLIRRGPIIAAPLSALLAIGALVGTFASAYASYGTTRDWSSPLSRLDALMVSLGNLSTAGTGGITPESETARGIVTLQYGLDLVAVLVVVGLLVGRLASQRA